MSENKKSPLDRLNEIRVEMMTARGKRFEALRLEYNEVVDSVYKGAVAEVAEEL